MKTSKIVLSGAAALTLMILAMPVLASNPKLVEFAQGAHEWRVVNDGVMGGRSSSTFEISKQGGSFEGMLSLENNGGFASVRTTGENWDLSGKDSFVLRIKGDGRRYKFTLTTSERRGSRYPLYQVEFGTKSGQWQEIRLPFEEFIPTSRGEVLENVGPFDPSKISSIGFLIADKKAGPFLLEVSSIAGTAESERGSADAAAKSK